VVKLAILDIILIKKSADTIQDVRTSHIRKALLIAVCWVKPRYCVAKKIAADRAEGWTEVHTLGAVIRYCLFPRGFIARLIN
jgi:threonine/homoserine efflux transporter RhtA